MCLFNFLQLHFPLASPFFGLLKIAFPIIKIAIIVLIIFLAIEWILSISKKDYLKEKFKGRVKEFFKRNKDFTKHKTKSGKSAEEVLKMKYILDEISEEEFERKMEKLQSFKNDN